MKKMKIKKMKDDFCFSTKRVCERVCERVCVSVCEVWEFVKDEFVNDD